MFIYILPIPPSYYVPSMFCIIFVCFLFFFSFLIIYSYMYTYILMVNILFFFFIYYNKGASLSLSLSLLYIKASIFYLNTSIDMWFSFNIHNGLQHQLESILLFVSCSSANFLNLNFGFFIYFTKALV